VIAETMANFEDRDPRPLFLVTGMINTKDAVGYVDAFRGIAERVFTVPIRGSDARIDPAVLASDAMEAGLTAAPVSTVAEALQAIGRIVEEDTVAPRILIGGSLYLVGDVLADNGTPPT